MIVTNQTTADIYFGPLHLGAGVGTQLTVDDTTATSLYLIDDTVADALNNAYTAGKITVSSQAQPFPRPTGVPQLLHGDGAPEGIVFAPQGSLYMRRDGTGANSLYVKTTGITLNTGWESFGSAVGGAGTEWDYAQVTAPTSITGTTEAAATSVVTGNTVVYDGTRVKVEFYAPSFAEPTSTTTASQLWGVLLRDSVVLGQFRLGAQRGYSGIGDFSWEGNNSHALFDTPAAGSHQYLVKAFYTGSSGWSVSAGAGGSGTLIPAFLRVTKA